MSVSDSRIISTALQLSRKHLKAYISGHERSLTALLIRDRINQFSFFHWMKGPQEGTYLYKSKLDGKDQESMQ